MKSRGLGDITFLLDETGSNSVEDWAALEKSELDTILAESSKEIKFFSRKKLTMLIRQLRTDRGYPLGDYDTTASPPQTKEQTKPITGKRKQV